MYIDPFLAGILATILTEAVFVIVAAVITANKKR